MIKKQFIIGSIIVAVLLLGGIYSLIKKGVDDTQKIDYAQEESATNTTATKTPIPSKSTVVPKSVTVTIGNYGYSPKVLTIKKGTTVTWINKDNVPHTITADNSGPTSANLGYNDKYTYTFNTAGIVGYHCELHNGMTGTIIVTD
jgi:plastocyanin